MDESKLDCLPTIEHVIKAAELHGQHVRVNLKRDWNQDQKPDFYLGMFAAMRIFQSGVVALQKDWATTDSEKERLDHLSMECFMRLGEIATIIMDKYELKDFIS